MTANVFVEKQQHHQNISGPNFRERFVTTKSNGYSQPIEK